MTSLLSHELEDQGHWPWFLCCFVGPLTGYSNDTENGGIKCFIIISTITALIRLSLFLLLCWKSLHTTGLYASYSLGSLFPSSFRSSFSCFRVFFQSTNLIMSLTCLKFLVAPIVYKKNNKACISLELLTVSWSYFRLQLEMILSHASAHMIKYIFPVFHLANSYSFKIYFRLMFLVGGLWNQLHLPPISFPNPCYAFHVKW